MTGAERVAALRARRRAQGLEEVRGIWAPKLMHEAIRKMAQGLCDKSQVAVPVGTKAASSTEET